MTDASQIITVTTDFGTRDGYVGTMKGVMLSIHPHIHIVDITHEIGAQDILGAALVLRNTCRAFPRGTIHVAVVDPGVGGERKPLLLQTESYVYIGPDNGIFSLAIDEAELIESIELNSSAYHLTPISGTFHGRDIFAPVAGYLSMGIDPKEFGSSTEKYMRLMIPPPSLHEREIVGQIIHVDRFGNCVTNIDTTVCNDIIEHRACSIDIGTRKLRAVSHSYSEVEQGCPLAIMGSSGFLEIGVNTGNAQHQLGLTCGDTIRIEVDDHE